MNIPHDKFCVLPWVSLETSPIGTVRPCCLADDELTDNAGDKFQLHNTTLATVQNSQDMRQLRRQFLDGEQPATCRRCWAEESAGRVSKRMHTQDRLKHMLPPQDWTIDAKPLMFLDLKLGNICNLKCRICGSWSSSTYAVEELANIPAADRKHSFHYTMLEQGRWPRENQQFWHSLHAQAQEIRYLEFTGGEPFMIAEHFDFLRRLVDLGLAHQIEIHYNTNGTQYPEAAEAIWSQFKLVEIAFSIDDTGARFEYQRSGADWHQVVANIERFRQLRARHTNIELQVCATVNIFNVYYLPELAAWIDQQAFDYVYWNIMHDAEYFSIAALPAATKQIIADHLRNSLVTSRTQREFDAIINFMRRGVATDGTRMLEEIARVDLRRNERLDQVAPELAEIIGYA